MATIGDRIDELTKEYIKIYNTLKDDPVLASKARNIALSDPILKKFTWEMVEKNVTKYIDLEENQIDQS